MSDGQNKKMKNKILSSTCNLQENSPRDTRAKNTFETMGAASWRVDDDMVILLLILWAALGVYFLLEVVVHLSSSVEG